MISKVATILWDIIDSLEKYNGSVTAVSTVFIGVFTWVLAKVTGRQARLTREALALARDEFIATHRPRVIVRVIHWPTPDLFYPPYIEVVIVNIGEGRAIVDKFGCDLARRKAAGKWLTLGADANPEDVSIPLTSGERHVFTIIVKPLSEAESEIEIFDSACHEYETCAFGTIRYVDESGVERETGFFRVYNPKAETFTPSDDPGKEYQD
jgi:hypothetical protein